MLCDSYKKVDNLGDGASKIGMPILYFKADPVGRYFNPQGSPVKEANRGFIYNSTDNMEMLELGMPWDVSSRHSLLDNFYECIKNNQISDARGRPRVKRPNSYILISAGWDGEYGTHDDITNFQK